MPRRRRTRSGRAVPLGGTTRTANPGGWSRPVVLRGIPGLGRYPDQEFPFGARMTRCIRTHPSGGTCSRMRVGGTDGARHRRVTPTAGDVKLYWSHVEARSALDRKSEFPVVRSGTRSPSGGFRFRYVWAYRAILACTFQKPARSTARAWIGGFVGRRASVRASSLMLHKTSRTGPRGSACRRPLRSARRPEK